MSNTYLGYCQRCDGYGRVQYYSETCTACDAIDKFQRIVDRDAYGHLALSRADIVRVTNAYKIIKGKNGTPHIAGKLAEMVQTELRRPKQVRTQRNVIKRREMEAEYRNLSQSRERRDCAVVAHAAAVGCSYAEAHARLKAAGRKDNQGTYQYTSHAAVKMAGKELVQIPQRQFIDRYPGVHKGLRNVTTHHMDRFPEVWADGRTYLVHVRGHILCVKNGKVLDWSRNKALRVVDIYEVK